MDRRLEDLKKNLTTPDHYTNHDAEEPGAIRGAAATDAGRRVRNRPGRATKRICHLQTSTVFNFVPMDGGHKASAPET